MKRAIVLLVALACASCAGSASSAEDDVVVVEVFGEYTGDEAAAFSAGLAAAERPGLDVRYVGSTDFVRELQRRVESGSPPDLAVISERGTIQDLTLEGQLLPLPESVIELAPKFVDPGQPGINLETVAVPYRLRINSLVWYRTDVFADNGWEPPTTLDSLIELSEQIAAADDVAPWCVGFGDRSQPGWPASDWIEDLFLRWGGPDGYDFWRSGGVPFDDPGVVAVFRDFERLVLEPGHTNVDLVDDLVRVEHRDAAASFLAAKPECAMYKASSAAAAWLDDPLRNDDRVDAFVLPGELPQSRPPVTVSVESVVRFTESPEVLEVLTSLATEDPAPSWKALGGYVPVDMFDDPTGPFARFVGGSFRVDASESMSTTQRDAFYSTLVDATADGFSDLEFQLEILEAAE